MEETNSTTTTTPKTTTIQPQTQSSTASISEEEERKNSETLHVGETFSENFKLLGGSNFELHFQRIDINIVYINDIEVGSFREAAFLFLI